MGGAWQRGHAKVQGQSNRFSWLLPSSPSPGSGGVPPPAQERARRPRSQGGRGGVLARRLRGQRLCGYLQQMRTSRLAKSSHRAHIRRGKPADLDALWELENQVFATDRMSRRSLRRPLASPSAVAIVARADGAVMGVAVVLFRANSRVARHYSLAVAPKYTGRGIASALLAMAEKIAMRRKCRSLRLEVHERKHGSIKAYRNAGYHEFGRCRHYYQGPGHGRLCGTALADHTSE